MVKQGSIFESVNGKVVVNNYFGQHSNGQSRTEAATVKLTGDEKEVLQKFCFEHDLAVSEFMRDATSFFLKYFDHTDKLTKYHEAVVAMLNQLP